METQTTIAVILPVALAITMFGLGLKLTTDDFKRVLQMPRLVAIGLVCQVLLLPLVAFALTKIFGLTPVFAMGLMILAAAPGGATANLMSHFAGGNVALNVTLTALNSVLAIVTVPLLVDLSYAHFFGSEAVSPANAGKIFQTLIVVMIPMGLAMWLNAADPQLGERLKKPIGVFSILFLVAVAVSAIIKERALIAMGIGAIGFAVLAFNLLSYSIGFVVPRILKARREEAIAIAMEVGIHNGTLAIAIASSPAMMNDMAMAVPAALYTIIMYITGAIWIQVLKRK